MLEISNLNSPGTGSESRTSMKGGVRWDVRVGTAIAHAWQSWGSFDL